MAKNTLTSTVEHSSKQNPSADGNALFAPEFVIVILTWVTFFVLFTILSKFAWKPILAGLEFRENNIRQAVEEAEKTREEYGRIDDKRKQILTEADHHAKDIIGQAREAALKNAKIIEERTKNEAQIIMENASREITAEQENVASYLKEKSAHAAVELASRILRENLDPAKHKKIIDNLIDEI